MFQCCSLFPLSSHPTLSSPHCVHKSVIYVCISTATLHIGSWVPFSRFHIYVLIYDICFSLWLTSLCVISCRFIHLIKTDSNVFFLWLSNIPLLEKEMATHSSVLAWRIPGTEKPDGLSSVESHRVGHDWSNLVAAAIFHCIYVPQFLYPFFCWWVSRLIPCPSFCK